MTRKSLAVLGILVILMVSVFGTVGAQSGTDPDETPTVVPTTETEPTSTKFFTHPVVKLLSAYFDQETEEEEVDSEEPTDPTVTETPDPANPEDTETGEEESGLGPIGEEIAAYHEDGMGFGVLVKVYAMVKASEEACAEQNESETEEAAPAEGDTTEGEPAEEACTPLTADELVTALKDGKGMGALFKEYGKPALLGVGHVKQELKKQQEAQQDEQVTGEEETEDEAVKGGKPDKEAKEKLEKLLKEHKVKKDKGPKK